MAPAHARTGTEVEDVVGGADGVLVVLDNDHGISQIAQPSQRAEEPVVVALMQPDARLVQNIQDARQPAPNLGCKPDALRLAAGKRAAFAVEGEIAEADFEEEIQPSQNLARDFGDDEFLLLAQHKMRHEIARPGDREPAECVDVYGLRIADCGLRRVGCRG